MKILKKHIYDKIHKYSIKKKRKYKKVSHKSISHKTVESMNSYDPIIEELFKEEMFLIF